MGLDGAGRLFVQPAGGHGPGFIARGGNGVRGSDLLAGMVAQAPEHWAQPERLTHILANIESQYGERLDARTSITWIKLSDEQLTVLQLRISA